MRDRQNRALPTLLLMAGVLACAHGSPPPAGPKGGPGSVKVVIPPGCEANLTGEFEHQDDPSYRYTAKDDGSLLTLHPFRLAEDGTAGDVSPKAHDLIIELRREPEGFVGVFKMTEEIDGGVKCQALFAAKVTACSASKLTLQIEQTYAMDQACKRVDTGGADMAEHVLVKRP